jgi:hypothetical protein
MKNLIRPGVNPEDAYAFSRTRIACPVPKFGRRMGCCYEALTTWHINVAQSTKILCFSVAEPAETLIV